MADQRERRPGRFGRILRRIGLGAGILMALLIVAGVVYEEVADAATQREFPPPGELVDVGGYRLHLHVTGESRPGVPTVVLEHGGSGMSVQWGWVQPELARHTQVVIYDRPGMGWSDAPPARLTADEAIRDLKRGLDSLGLEGPYVVIGHSLGGLLARVFAQLYPEETAGLVLVDPVTVERHELLPYGVDPVVLGFVQTLARLGVIRLSGIAAQESAGLPDEHFNQGVAMFPSYRQVRGWGQEGHLGETGIAYLRDSEEQLDQMPLIVLEAGAADGAFDAAQREVLAELYARLTARSSQGSVRRVEGAGHVTIVTQAHYAQAIVDATLDLIRELP